MAFVSTDEGRFFGEAAFKKVASAADRLLKEKRTDLLVETAPTPGKLAPDKAAALNPAEREKLIRGLAEERGSELNLKGVYILMCQNPLCLYVHVTDPSEFPPGFATKVKIALLESIRDKKFDEGLEKAIALTLDARGLGEKK